MSYQLNDVINSKYIAAEEIANGKRRYIGIEHREEIADMAAVNHVNQGHMYEVISYPAYGFMDFDHTTREEVKRVEEKLLQRGIIAIVSPNTENMNKFHIYLPTMLFKTPSAMKEYMVELSDELDPAVYRINGLMRLPYNKKVGRTDYYTIPAQFSKEMCIISAGTGHFRVVGEAKETKSPRPPSSRSGLRGATGRNTQNHGLLRMLEKSYPEFDIIEVKPGTFNLIRKEPAYCPIHHRIHEHVGQQIVLSSGRLYLKCQGKRRFLRSWDPMH